ncbi:uncharacterized protein LOC124105917 [Marmota monax]|uniref:uncharacterized protein LOC124105917 n=1 Tax=Marmota monax TaxID=9995 RepID=UPI001EB081DD|nr:uncharacterized protein LOC124105917 [Marmota monax]XP_046319306.1 uncharacterized protein LOC124105917 [Marmota monax]XP_046319307.1 uncharacterized protein LOC124105917 [Marmota monax]
MTGHQAARTARGDLGARGPAGQAETASWTPPLALKSSLRAQGTWASSGTQVPYPSPQSCLLSCAQVVRRRGPQGPAGGWSWTAQKPPCRGSAHARCGHILWQGPRPRRGLASASCPPQAGTAEQPHNPTYRTPASGSWWLRLRLRPRAWPRSSPPSPAPAAPAPNPGPGGGRVAPRLAWPRPNAFRLHELVPTWPPPRSWVGTNLGDTLQPANSSRGALRRGGGIHRSSQAIWGTQAHAKASSTSGPSSRSPKREGLAWEGPGKAAPSLGSDHRSHRYRRRRTSTAPRVPRCGCACQVCVGSVGVRHRSTCVYVFTGV